MTPRSADEPGQSVLIVDDDPNTAEAHSAVLGRRRHRVRVARTDAEALAGLADGRPDVVILDLDVGPKTAAALEQITNRPLLIALLKPGSAQGFSRERLSAFDLVFFKAVSPGILAEKIAEFMARGPRPS
jgi:DNA-binding response OmpR family regulator